MKKLLFFWNELMASFWFLPVLMLGFSIILSVGLVHLDTYIMLPDKGLYRFFLVSSSDSARSILSTISGAMIGVAGTVFSVTLVALTLASSQFGPRLIKNFMYVRLNQVVLGSYISTYIYCLIILNTVKNSNDYSFTPSISILFAILAAIANIVLLIFFIHNIAVSIQADKVISDISGYISNQIKTLFPDKMEEVDDSDECVDVSSVISGFLERIPIQSQKSGYIQYINSESLLKVVTRYDALLELNYRTGSHLVEGIEIGVLYSNSKYEEENLKKILDQFVIGKIKMSQHDLEYSIHQMVEIAVRALSPGVNDPYTAIACIDNLSATMSWLAQARFPSKYHYDDEKKLRMIADTLDFEGMLDSAFNQIRQFSGGSTAVIIRLMEALIIIQGFVKNERHQKAVLKHAQMVLNIGKQTINEEEDMKDLMKRSEKFARSS